MQSIITNNQQTTTLPISLQKIKIEYSDLLFLYVYLKQADLSLDRCRWTNWNELQDYYSKESINPRLILDYFVNKYHLPIDNLKPIFCLPKRKKLYSTLKTSFFKQSFLETEDLLYCSRLLLDLEKALQTNTNNYNKIFEILRLDIATFYSELLEPMLTFYDLKHKTSIEHYHQAYASENLKLKEYLPQKLRRELAITNSTSLS